MDTPSPSPAPGKKSPPVHKPPPEEKHAPTLEPVKKPPVATVVALEPVTTVTVPPVVTTTTGTTPAPLTAGPPPAPLPTPKMSGATITALVLGALIFLAAGVIATLAGVKSFDTIEKPLAASLEKGGQDPISAMLEKAPSADNGHLILYHRILEAQVYHRALADRHAVLLASMALSFGLMALGYGLFVQGIEGAVTLNASRGGDTAPDGLRLAFSTQTPGAFCFLLGAILCVVNATRSFEIKLSDLKFTAPGGAAATAPSQPSPPPTAEDAGPPERASKDLVKALNTLGRKKGKDATTTPEPAK